VKLFCAFLVLVAVLFAHSSAYAQCAGGSTASCVTSASLAPSSIPGDGSGLANVTVQAHLAGTTPMTFYLQISEVSFGSTETFCPASKFNFVTGSGCIYPNIGPGDVTLTFSVNGSNPGTTTQNGTIELQNWSGSDPAVDVSIQVTPIASPWETPDQEPDGWPAIRTG
jgi:hypothetical protein